MLPAVNNADVVIYTDSDLVSLPISELIPTLNTSEVKSIDIDDGSTVSIYDINENVSIQGFRVFSNYRKFSLLPVKQIVKLSNAPTYYNVKFNVDTKKQFISNFICEDIIKNRIITRKNTISSHSGVDLTFELGYLIGQWISRGFVYKAGELSGCAVIPILAETHNNIVDKIKHIDMFLKTTKKNELLVITCPLINSLIIDEFSPDLNDWLLSADVEFLEGIIVGLFQSSGIISFNKSKKKAYLVLKTLNDYSKLWDELEFMFTSSYITSKLSFTTDSTVNKISFSLTNSLINVLNSGFENGWVFCKGKKSKLDIAAKLKIFNSITINHEKVNQTSPDLYALILGRGNHYLLKSNIFIPATALKI